MKFTTRLIGLFASAALLTGGAVAEDLPLPDPGELLLPDESLDPPWAPGTNRLLRVPGRDDQGPSFQNSEMDDASVLTEPWAPAIDQLLQVPGRVEPFQDYGDAADCNCDNHSYHLWNGETATPVTSGTWLERGMWYAEAEAVVFQRLWNRDDTMYAADDPNVTNRNFSPPIVGFLNTNRVIILQGDHPGEDASVRTTLGRFLFRDGRNRDHTAEFTVFGGGDWVSDHVVESASPNGLFTPFFLARGNRAFDGSTRQEVIYSSRFNSFELNYRVKQRLGRDQMVMDPNGHWRREASSGLKREFLFGLRYLEMREILDWRAEDILVVGDDGTYLINTDNDLFGVQVGAGFGYESGRWSLGLHGTTGLFVNDADTSSQLNFTADDTDDFNIHSTEDELSFLAEVGLLGRWHMTPSFSLRAGLELMFIESLALAPNQVDFITNTSRITTTGYAFYMGGLVGFEGYW